ncbi:MAG: putative lipid II flippase FtsW [Actinobacteria bacterium]|uniref:peptidoglycan glycosyltransferase n=1 Tax=freshwater metagenome TaxID=449393 RepID=A0A6J6RIK5_9ZZZZ|nr:putative lipid II flippase FtsW [Actinomycetota bacterium]MSX71653.1 putative lipid II flippase FtsW [Actinomycetota bacterium]MSY69128.1 putative lipid II flippase FtsW [Actinomycetota bacterium]MTA75652.1 putative lipid II flippase FtsW [Actinomycetota bacterium]
MKTEKRTNIFNRPINLYYMLVGSTLGLSIFGLIMVFSASSIYSLENKGSSWAILLRQFIFLVISIPMAWVLSRFSFTRWKFIARFGFIISVGLLIIVQIPGVGKSVNGNHNWISLGFVDVQPSEVAKFLMILWAGAILAKRERAGDIQANVLKLIAPVYLLCIGLVLLGRDLGTASVFAFVLAGLLWVSGVHLKLFAAISGVGFLGIAALILSAPYRVARFSVFLNPFAADQYKSVGWQPAHSLLGLASGGLFGVGLGASRQKWGNLPEAHTDFIFSVIGEELGLFGTLAVLLALSILIFSIFKIALRANDPMVRYVCSGIGCWIGVQTILNIGSAISVLPVVGVTLPLLSYGGSALIATYMGIAFVIGAARRDPAIYSELEKAGFPQWLR